MKKLYIFTACVLALAMIGLCGCQKTGEQEAPEQENPEQAQVLKTNASEQTPEQDALKTASLEQTPGQDALNPDSQATSQPEAPPEPEITPEVENFLKKDVITTIVDYAAPDYEYQLYESDDVILGQVEKTLEGKLLYPDRPSDEINEVITPYVVRIDKSYKGSLTEGDTVLVCAWNYSASYLEDDDSITIVDTSHEFYLHDGQRGVFQLVYSDFLSTTFGQPMYEVACQNEGFFEQKEKDGALVYASPSFEITLDQIPEDIKKADEQYEK